MKSKLKEKKVYNGMILAEQPKKILDLKLEKPTKNWHGLEANEQKLLCYIMSRIRSLKHLDCKYYGCHEFLKDVPEWIVSQEGFFDLLVSTYEHITTGTVVRAKIDENDRYYNVYLPVFMNGEYNGQTHEFVVVVNDHIEKAFLRLKEKYDKYLLFYISKLQSKYSIRLLRMFINYNLVKHYSEYKLTVDLKQFKRDMIAHHYKNASEIKKNILDVAAREINEKTYYNVDYDLSGDKINFAVALGTPDYDEYLEKARQYYIEDGCLKHKDCSL